MINIEKESLQRKYCSQLTALRNFKAWTLEQIKGYLHIDHSTVKKFVANGLLYESKFSRCLLYLPKNEEYSNDLMIKSVLDIDLHYLINDNFESCVPVSEQTLIQRNVVKLGYKDGVSYYSASYIYPIDSIYHYRKIEKLLIDIQNYSDTDSAYVYFTAPAIDKDGFLKYVNDSHNKIYEYLASKLIYSRFIANEHKCFKYIKPEKS